MSNIFYYFNPFRGPHKVAHFLLRVKVLDSFGENLIEVWSAMGEDEQAKEKAGR